MNEQWFWETKGELFGPLSTNELEGLISAKKIRASDRLKLGEKGEWLSGTEVMELVGTSPAGTGRSTAQSADDVLHDMHRRQVERLVAGGEDKFSPTHHLNRLWTVAKDAKEWCISILAAAVGLAFTRRGKIITITACCLIVCAAILGRLHLYGTPPQEIYETLAAIRNEAQSLQETNADKVKWQEFTDSVRPVLAEIGTISLSEIKTINGGREFVLKSTYWDYQAKRLFYQISKYDFPKMLACGADKECFTISLNAANQNFQLSEKCLVNYSQLTFATNIDWRSVAMNFGVPRSWVASAVPKKGKEPISSTWDPMTISIIVVDVVFVAGLIWVFRKSLMFWKPRTQAAR